MTLPPKTMDRPTAAAVEPEVFLSSHRTISDWKLKAANVVASGKASTNTAKSMGVNIKAYKNAIRLSKVDREEAEREIRDTLFYCRLLDLGLFDQMDLFAPLGDNSGLGTLTASVMRDHKAWEAERAGYENGKFGDPLDNNPHDAGTETHERYVVGWHNGNAYRKEAEARGEKIIRPKKRGKGNPEDHQDEGSED